MSRASDQDIAAAREAAEAFVAKCREIAERYQSADQTYFIAAASLTKTLVEGAGEPSDLAALFGGIAGYMKHEGVKLGELTGAFITTATAVYQPPRINQ